MKPADTDRPTNGANGSTFSTSANEQIVLAWQGYQLPVLAMDKVSFVADASSVPQASFHNILETSAEQAAEPIGHTATLIGGGYGRVPIDFFLLENHETLLRCQFGELISKRKDVLASMHSNVSAQDGTPSSTGEMHPSAPVEKKIEYTSAGRHSINTNPLRPRRGKKLRNTLVGGSLATLAAIGFVNRGELSPDVESVAFQSATVSTSMVDVQSPVDGRLQSLLVEVGDAVSKGQVVAELTPLVDTKRDEALEERIGQLNTELSILEKAKADLADAIQIARQDAMLKAQEGQAYLDELTAKHESWKAKMLRLDPLIADGTISEAEGKQLRSEMESAHAAVRRQTRTMERIRLANTAADRDILITRDGVTPVVELDSKIALVNSQVDDLRKQSNSMLQDAQPIELIASANGVIESVEVTVGETVLAGRPAIGLQIADPSTVMALLPFDSGDAVAVGDKVDVKLTRLGVESIGTVQGIEPSDENGDVMVTSIQIDAESGMLSEALPNERVEVALLE